MCGLCGVYSKSFGTLEYQIFQHLLFLNYLRGTDSTGVIRVEKNKKVTSRKSLLDSPTFLSSDVSDIVDDVKGQDFPLCLIGHTRAATKGKVTLKNAHPFKFPANNPKLFGMHNGTINGSFTYRSQYETDSEALYRLIYEKGIEKALNEVVNGSFDPAYALQYVDKRDGTLNFIKNNKRPLFFTYIYAGSTLIWSSERKMLELVVAHKKLTPRGWDGSEKDPYFTLKDHDLFSLELGESPKDMAIDPIKVEKKATTYTTAGVYGQTQNGGTTSQSSTAIPQGEWVQKDGGYSWVPKKPALIVDNTQEPEVFRGQGQSGTQHGTTTSKSGLTTPSTSGSGPSKGGSSFRDRFSTDDLRRLAWLRPVPERVDPDVDSGDRPYVGYQGRAMSEGEFAFRMKEGCSCCSKQLDPNDPHDFANVNHIHWSHVDTWFCDTCYENSEGDWVRMTVDNTWQSQTAKKG